MADGQQTLKETQERMSGANIWRLCTNICVEKFAINSAKIF